MLQESWKTILYWSSQLILTYCLCSLQNSCVIETGLSDVYKMVTTDMKTTFSKIEAKVVKQSYHKSFCCNDTL